MKTSSLRRPARDEMRIAVLALILAASPALAEAGPVSVSCPGLSVTVEAADPALVDRTCRSALWAAQRIRTCGFACDVPVSIRVSDNPRLPWDNCLAAYDSADETIEIASPARLADILKPESGFAGLDPGLLFDSLVVHEMTHACLNPQLDLGADEIAKAEYAPYALQFDFLPEDDRQSILDRYTPSGPIDLDQLAPLVLAFDPALSGARSWRHFTGPGGGCAFLHALAEDTARLPSLEEW
jgi:hypothetical protein